MIENLAFNVAQLLKEPIGATRSVEVRGDIALLAPDLPLAETEATELPLIGKVQLLHVAGGVLVQGLLRAEVPFSCARCLEPVPTPLLVELEEIFVSTVDVLTGHALVMEEEDRALWIDDHHILNLSEVLRQAVMVSAPMHVLCRPDCRGLCPTCGENLNTGSCLCQPEPDARWAPLKSLLSQAE